MKARWTVFCMLTLLASPSARAEDFRLHHVERWAAGALLTAWNGKTYTDRSCFSADGSSVSCGSSGVAQVRSQTGVEYTVSAGNTTDVPLDCLVKAGDSSPIPFSLLTKGTSREEAIRVPSAAKQSFEVICEAPLDQVLASSGAAGRARITVFHNIKSGKTSRRATVLK